MDLLNVISNFTHNSNDLRGLEVNDNLRNNPTNLLPQYETYLFNSWIRIIKIGYDGTSHIWKKYYFDFLYPNGLVNDKNEVTYLDSNGDMRENILGGIEVIIDNKVGQAIDYIENYIGPIDTDDILTYREFKDFFNLPNNDSDIILTDERDEFQATIEDFITNYIDLDDSYRVRFFNDQNLEMLKNINNKLAENNFNIKMSDLSFPKNKLVQEISKDYSSYNFLYYINKVNVLNPTDITIRDRLYLLFEKNAPLDDKFIGTAQYSEYGTLNAYKVKSIKGEPIDPNIIDSSNVYVLKLDNSEVEVNINKADYSSSSSDEDICLKVLNLNRQKCEDFVNTLNGNVLNADLKDFLKNDKIYEYYNIIFYSDLILKLNFINKMLTKLNFSILEKDIYLFPISYGNAVITELIMEKYHKKTIKYYQSFKDWCKSNKIENEIANNKNLEIFLSNCIEIINNILSYLNLNVFNENFLNSFISQDSDTLDRFYKKLDLNFKDKLDEDYINKFNKFKLSFNGQNLVGIILSYNDNKSKQLLNVIKDLLNLNHSS